MHPFNEQLELIAYHNQCRQKASCKAQIQMCALNLITMITIYIVTTILIINPNSESIPVHGVTTTSNGYGTNKNGLFELRNYALKSRVVADLHTCGHN